MTPLPPFLKEAKRVPGAIVERMEGDRSVTWFRGDRTIDLHGEFTADELRQIVAMMEEPQ